MSQKCVIVTTVIEIETVRIPARSRRQAMDWSLVLLSQGIESTIESPAESGWGLLVEAPDHERAQQILKQYQAENRRWPWRRELTQEGTLFDWGSLGWVALIGVFFWLQMRGNLNVRDAGLMDAVAVSHGEWWRLFTAVFLHADIAHFALNATLGFCLLGLTMGRWGTGVGLLAAYLSGVGGNVATWLIYSEGHRSLGASGMVMGCVGLLAAGAFAPGRASANGFKYTVAGLAAGVMLFALLGLGPGTDVLAHLGGFLSGLGLGFLLLLVPGISRSFAANIFAGLAFCVLVILPWWFADKLSGT